jgi:hypothetical protein
MCRETGEKKRAEKRREEAGEDDDARVLRNPSFFWAVVSHPPKTLLLCYGPLFTPASNRKLLPVKFVVESAARDINPLVICKLLKLSRVNVFVIQRAYILDLIELYT